MALQRSYYQVLGVSPESSSIEIKKKYRDLARQFHPDVAADKELGLLVFSQATRAYKVLINEENRADYDAFLEGRPVTRPVVSTAVDAAAEAAEVAALLWEAEDSMGCCEYDRAQKKCDEALRIAPRMVRALRILGDAHLEAGQYSLAMIAYDQVKAIAPSTLIEMKRERLKALMASVQPASHNEAEPGGPKSQGKSRSTVRKTDGLLNRVFNTPIKLGYAS